MKTTYNARRLAMAAGSMVLLLTAGAAQASAEEPPERQVAVGEAYSTNDSSHEHQGVFFRATIGAGAGGYHTAGATESVRLSPGSQTRLDEFNASGTLTLSLGSALREDLILHGDLILFDVQEGDDDPIDGALETYSLGLGLTRYIMPANVYLTASVGLAATLLQDEEHRFENDAYGVLGTLAVGKEWWLSDEWGVGFSLRGNYAYTTDGDVQYHQGTGQIVCSATFN